ncbi:fimbrial biogenesis chaperone [Burkholderia alba]|uniref:fimbrial biogenesis chaperone n=1 Tax=Burkholderia alba TaxID=2683677 RepID=UPI002B060F78|nr:molecular chaperone [Burkholderia alba]
MMIFNPSTFTFNNFEINKLTKQKNNGSTFTSIFDSPSILRILISLLLVSVLPTAHAELDFDSRNRFIFEEGSKRLSIVISNRGEHPTLVQSSLSWGDGRKAELPLALNKPMQIIGPGQKGAVEVFYEGSGFPEDRESYLLLSVLDLSQAPRDPNSVQVALLHHFKLFFRPKFEQTTQQAIASLKWDMSSRAAYPVVDNPSPYFITLSDIQLMDHAAKACGQVVDHLMVAPFSQLTLPDSGCKAPLRSARYNYVTDSGNMRPYQVQLSSGGVNAGTVVE